MKALLTGLAVLAAVYMALIIYWSPRAVIKRTRARGVYVPRQHWERGAVRP
jgi:hypothetical protein